MKPLILATDYDGTIARDGTVAPSTIAALHRYKEWGGKPVLVSGRELPDLLGVFPEIDLFELAVLENGALLYWPSTKKRLALADPPSPVFIEKLRAHNLQMSVGEVIVATWEPYQQIVLDTIRDLGLELQVIFNKGAVMILPSGINKAFGLKKALTELGFSLHNVVGVGDAENDHAFLTASEYGVAVANALPMLKEQADLVMTKDHGEGVEELIDLIINKQLPVKRRVNSRRSFDVGCDGNGEAVRLLPDGASIIIGGSSGAGKSTFAKTFLEELYAGQYQFCVFDPEGDYDSVEGAVTIGTASRPPSIEEVLSVATKPEQSVVVNLVAVPHADRPSAFLTLFSALENLRREKGHPHWYIIDEAHHVLPAAHKEFSAPYISSMTQTVLITLNPTEVLHEVVKSMGSVIGVGEKSEDAIREWAGIKGISVPQFPEVAPDAKPVIMWRQEEQQPPFLLKVRKPRAPHHRHRRKYAEGDIRPEISFYFKGREGKLNLRANNLITFIQLAEGVDDDTWNFHLKRHEYSNWFRDVINDDVLARQALTVEDDESLGALESKKAIVNAVSAEYTLPGRNGR